MQRASIFLQIFVTFCGRQCRAREYENGAAATIGRLADRPTIALVLIGVSLVNCDRALRRWSARRQRDGRREARVCDKRRRPAAATHRRACAARWLHDGDGRKQKSASSQSLEATAVATCATAACLFSQSTATARAVAAVAAAATAAAVAAVAAATAVAVARLFVIYGLVVD